MIFKANDKFRTALRSTWISSPADGSLLVGAVPDDVPTIVVVGWRTAFEAVFSVTGKSGSTAADYALTGVTWLRGYVGNLAENSTVNCLNNEEFFNQYATLFGRFSDMVDTTGLDIAQIATPANPSAGRNKIYTKTGDKVYSLTSAGVESTLSSEAYVDTAVASGASSNGWNTESATVTRTGSYTFTLVGNQTAKYTKGTKFRYKDGGSFEYGYVEVSAFSSVATVTLVTNGDYTMAAVSITEPAFSYAQNPQGFPDFFSFTTTFTGFSADPSTNTFYFKLDAFMLSFYYVDGSDGTSNSTGLTFTIPVNAKRSLNQAGLFTVKDNGTISVTPGHLTTTANSKTVNAYRVFSQGVWTSSAAKNIYMPVISFEWT